MMRYFGTSFSLVLGGLRLRVRIDLDDDPDEQTVHSLRVHEATRSREGRESSSSTSR
jgi:hypothetical protein